MQERIIFKEMSVPKLPRGILLQHDKVRDIWVLQGPERRFELDTIAAEILQHIDGIHTISDIVDVFFKKYKAPRERVLQDITAMLQDLGDKGIMGL